MVVKTAPDMETQARAEKYARDSVLAAVKMLRPECATLQRIRLLAGVSTRRTVEALWSLLEEGVIVRQGSTYRECVVRRAKRSR